MRASRWTLPALLLLEFSLTGLSLAAEKQTPAFHAGEWQIDSVITVAGGRTISSKTHLCAKTQMDFWKVAQNGLSCKQAQSVPASDETRIQVNCVYDRNKLHSDIHWDAIETVAKDGNSFTLTGTSKTYTVYQGVRPTRTTAQLQASAHRVGDCP